MQQAKAVLAKYWAYDSFRHPQQEIIAAVLDGQDVFAMLPTGGGKSLCYQVPALLFSGVTFVVSPLIALIEDQVHHLRKRGIPVGFIHSGMDKVEANMAIENLNRGIYKLFYVSPERLQSEQFLDQIVDVPIDFLAIDEAHCISQWGHDFRPSYRLIQHFKDKYPNIITLAVTASATNVVKKDIITLLSLYKPKVFELSVVRPNLSYEIKYEEAKEPELSKIFQERQGTGIVYCGTRRKTVELATDLSQYIGNNVYYYHAGMHKKEKDFAYHQWSQKDNAIICATSAFGMGIDKADVRTVAHVDLPTSIEQYYQEVGRAGRDGLPAKGILLFNNGDINRLLRLPDTQFPSTDFIVDVYQKLMDYLQIGVGEGIEMVKAFEILDFTKTFNLSILVTISALRILEQEGFFIWSEDAKTKYTVRLTTTRTHLEYLEKNYRPLYEVVEVLLRHYGSVFHFDTVIQIFEMSKVLKIDKTIFEDRLYQLQDMGILQYSPAIVGSFIVFLENRFNLAYLNINETRLKERKAEFISKIQSLIAYIEEQHQCRNVILSIYFGQGANIENCGNCDNCLRSTAINNQSIIKKEIIAMVQQHKRISIQTIVDKFSKYPSAQVLQYLRDIVNEGHISVDESDVHI